MPFQIIRNDITKVRADAVVDTANPDPRIGGGTDSAIYDAAGAEQLLAERKKIGKIAVGEAAVTSAFALPAKYIIHTVGPVWEGGDRGELEHLASCYRRSLFLAKQLGCESIAFPLISTGVYGFPKDRALRVALREISGFLETEEMDVLLVVFDKQSFEVSSELAEHVRQYIGDHYAALREAEEYRCDMSSMAPMAGNMPALADSAPAETERRRRLFARRRRKQAEQAEELFGPVVPREGTAGLQEIVRNAGESFQGRLFRLIDERGMTDPEVYRKANISRKLFSKIRCSEDYVPGKRTVLALAVALELNLDQAVDLLSRAGLAFSPGSTFDLIVKYCIENHIYDIYDINTLLFDYDQPLLGNALAE